MSGVLIVAPLPIAAVPTVAGVGAANLRTADPREVWTAPSTADVGMDIDMGSVVEVDSFFIGYTNAHPSCTWTIHRASAPGVDLVLISAETLLRAADSLGPRHHGFVRLPAPVASRHFRITIEQGGAAPISAGALVIGRAFEKHREYGAGRTMIDTGERQDLVSGGFGMGDGTVKAQFAFSFIDLTDAEVHTLEGIQRDRGLRRPVVVVENTDLTIGRNEAIHYGVFERFAANERQDPTSTKWAGTVVEWA